MSKTTINQLLKMKQDGQKFATITAYDATFAKLFDEEGIPAILIGDSLGMVIQGHSDTLPVTIDEMAYHTRCVRRGTTNALVIADLSFMTYADTASACQKDWMMLVDAPTVLHLPCPLRVSMMTRVVDAVAAWPSRMRTL